MNARRRLLFACLSFAAVLSAAGPGGAIGPAHAAAAAVKCAAPRSQPFSLALATPATIGAATLATPEAGLGQTADGQLLNAATSAQIENVIELVAACQSKGDYKTLATLFSANYINTAYGGGGDLSVAEFIALGKDLPTVAVSIVSASDFRAGLKGDVSADVVWQTGHQLNHARWTFAPKPDPAGDASGAIGAQDSGVWTVSAQTPLPVAAPSGAVTLKIKLTDTAMTPPALAAHRGGDLVLAGTNSGKQDHELLVLRMTNGVTIADLLHSPGPKFPAGVLFIGQVTIPAKTSGQLVLTNMPRGSYVIVDLLPDPDGNPYLSDGLAATLTVS